MFTFTLDVFTIPPFGRVYKRRNNQLRNFSMQGGTHIIASHQHPFHQRSFADTQGQPPISASNGWAGGTNGGVMNSNEGAPLGTFINGLLPETSATWLSIIRQPGTPSYGMMGAVMRSLTGGWGRHATTPFEVFITVFCHYMIKVISGMGWTALTRTVFSACNKSMISSDDKRTC